MFFSIRTLPAVALALSALSLATPTRRAPALEVSLSAPKSVDSVTHAKVVASVTNTGSESVKVLKYGTVLDAGLPTKSFTITKDGKEVTFGGVKLSIDIERLDEDAFAVINAGETYTVTHDVSALYDFEAAGTGAFKFEPITTFQVVPGDAKIGEYKMSPENTLKITAANVDVEITKDVAKRELEVLDKRATVSCTNTSQRSFISSSYSEAKTLATVTANYISSNGANSLFTSYFKTNSPTTVRSRFTAVANENSSSRTLNCSDPYGVCTGGVIAYTVTSTTNIYFCSIFYNEVPSTSLCSGTTVASRNVRGGTTLHELTHALSGTTDVGYGCSYDQGLSAANALRNADNYNCFATQVYQNTQC